MHVMTGGGVWVQLNQKQYIIKGMAHGMGLHLVYTKRDDFGNENWIASTCSNIFWMVPNYM